MAGTSVGALNGAVVAEHPTLRDAVAVLHRTWRGIRRRQVFPGGPAKQALKVQR